MSSSERGLKLIRRATTGDDEATAHLLFEHYGDLAHLVKMEMPDWMRRHVDVDDILQDTFSQAFRDIQHSEARTEEHLVAWLKKIATNRLKDWRRRLEAQKRPPERRSVRLMSDSALAQIKELTDETETPSHIAAVNERGHALQVSIARLPDDQQQAVRLYSLEQRGLEEVAEVMGRSPDSVRGLLHRAKKALREHLGKSSMWFSRR